MQLVTFDPFRSLGLGGASFLKPEQVLESLPARTELAGADWVLFAPTWQVNALAYGLGCRLFPSLATYHVGYSKVEMTRAFQAIAPEHVPRTLIVAADREGAERVADELGFPIVVKAPRAARGEGVELIGSRRELEGWVAEQDVLYAQEYLPAERDLRVVVAGSGIVAAYWRVGGDGLRHNLARGGRIDPELPDTGALALVERVAGTLGVDYAGFDVLVADGQPYLLELNVFFGLQGIRDLGIDLAGPIRAYLAARLEEDEPPRPRTAPKGHRLRRPRQRAA